MPFPRLTDGLRVGNHQVGQQQVSLRAFPAADVLRMALLVQADVLRAHALREVRVVLRHGLALKGGHARRGENLPFRPVHRHRVRRGARRQAQLGGQVHLRTAAGHRHPAADQVALRAFRHVRAQSFGKIQQIHISSFHLLCVFRECRGP